MKDDEKFFLNPNEMAFRKIYWPLLQEEKITKVFRPGSRPCGLWRGYCENQEVEAKVIDKIGSDWAKIEPVFVDGLSKKIIITNVEIKKIQDLNSADFDGATPDVYDAQSLKYNLGVIYNLFPDDLSDDSLVTITSFNYL